jgi:reductive dehalogenase
MSPIQYLFLLTGALLLLFLILFALASAREGRFRAVRASCAAFAGLSVCWMVAFLFLEDAPAVLSTAAVLVWLFVLLFFFPVGKIRALRVHEISERVDERDVIFAREEYLPGTEKHEIYYAMRPENLEKDDKIRALPELLAPGGRHFDPVRSRHISTLFRIIEHLTTKVDGEIARAETETEPYQRTQAIKTMVRRLGADEVGVARLDPMFVYSHVGRGPEAWGAPIENRHRFAVVFSMEMDYGHVACAPELGITEETAHQYLKGAQISVALARYIRSLGYPARAHIAGSNYQILLPPVAHDAGLGELGRLGYLISPRYGARVRLGAVTTDLELAVDQPIRFGVQNFCDRCLKCARNCPSGAIPRGGKTLVRGVEKWQLDIERCLHYWRVLGTDCGLCMKVCPYSHPPTFVHNVVRAGIARSAFAQRLALWGDDLFYGRMSD